MTQQDARERAWETWWELVVGDDEPGEDTHDPHFNFMGGYDAAKSEDEQSLREAQESIAALVAACNEAADWLDSRPDFTEGDAATSSMLRALAGQP